MKIRIIERNDGFFQYEFINKPIKNKKTDKFNLLDRAEAMLFTTESEARKYAGDIVKSMTAGLTKRVVEEIDIG